MFSRLRWTVLCAVLFTTGGLGACGLTGELYLPESDAPDSEQEAGVEATQQDEQQSEPQSAPNGTEAKDDTEADKQ